MHSLLDSYLDRHFENTHPSTTPMLLKLVSSGKLQPGKLFGCVSKYVVRLHNVVQRKPVRHEGALKVVLKNEGVPHIRS